MKLHIRSFESADRSPVWSLHNEALRGMGPGSRNGVWDDDVRDPEAAYLERGGEFLVGLLGADIVAMGALLPTSSSSGEIRRMRVAPHHQRQGFGTQILVALERQAIERGMNRLHLDTTVQQKGAQALYLKHGYSELRRATRGPFELIFYEKQLCPTPDAERELVPDGPLPDPQVK